jgi:hypothetical protein
MDIGGQIMDNKLSDFRRIRIEIIHGRYNVWGVLAWLSFIYCLKCVFFLLYLRNNSWRPLFVWRLSIIWQHNSMLTLTAESDQIY